MPKRKKPRGMVAVRKPDHSTVIVETGTGAHGILTNLGSDQARAGVNDAPARIQTAGPAVTVTPNTIAELVRRMNGTAAPDAQEAEEQAPEVHVSESPAVTDATEEAPSDAAHVNSTHLSARAMELAMTRSIARHFGVPFVDNEEYVKTLRRISGERNPEERAAIVDKEWAAVTDLNPRVFGLLTQRAGTEDNPGVGPVVAVNWVGDQTGLDKSTADIRVTHASGAYSYLSLKSVNVGQGTARNIGGEGLELLTKAPVTEIRTAMYDDVLAAITTADPARGEELAKLSLGERKYALTRTERTVARRVGREATSKVAKNIAESFHGMRRDDKEAFITAAIGSNPLLRQGDVEYVAYAAKASKRSAILNYKPMPPAHEITVEYDEKFPQQVKFHHNGELLVRFAFTCTNGMGLSAICARTFMK